MRALFQWSRQNLALPLGMVALSSLLAVGYQSLEISESQYRTLRSTYLEGTPRYRMEVSKAIETGSISNGVYTRLVKDFWGDSHSLAIDAVKEGQGREALLTEIKNSKGNTQ